jgi:hypothetical protein
MNIAQCQFCNARHGEPHTEDCPAHPRNNVAANPPYPQFEWPMKVPPLDAIPPEPSYMERLRDEFAMHAMAAMVLYLALKEDDPPTLRRDHLAERSYEIADAMLAERGKR